MSNRFTAFDRFMAWLFGHDPDRKQLDRIRTDEPVGKKEFGYHGRISMPYVYTHVSRIEGLKAQQTYIDRYRAAVLVDWSGYFGDKGAEPCAVVGAHNHGSFKGLSHAEPGMTITVTTSYGVWKYTVADTCVVSSRQDLIDLAFEGLYDLILYTCYPFEADAETEARFLVCAVIRTKSSEGADQLQEG